MTHTKTLANGTVLESLVANIIDLRVDAIVNAANSSLLGGGGVDGAIHRAAGPELAMECRMLNGCKTGQAKITKAYHLPVRHIIHTVGPIWRGGTFGEDDLLTSCYRNSLALADANQLTSLAFPAISTGIYKFPPDRAATISLQATEQYFASETSSVRQVVFCSYSDAAEHYMHNAFAAAS